MKPIKFGAPLTLKLEYGYFTGDLKLPSFVKLFKGKRGVALVEIIPVADDPDDPDSPSELDSVVRAGIEWLVANERDMAKALGAAITAKHPKAVFGKTVEMTSVHFHDVENGALPYLGFELACDWDDEHGLGVMTHGTRIVKVGQADTALLEWIAEGDAKKTRKKPKKPAKAKKKSRS